MSPSASFARCRSFCFPRSEAPDRATDSPQFWLCIRAGLAAATLAVAYRVRRAHHVEADTPDPMILASIKAGGWSLTMAAIAVVIVAPVGEEMLFRGLLLGRFGAYGHWLVGVISSTAMFGYWPTAARRTPWSYSRADCSWRGCIVTPVALAADCLARSEQQRGIRACDGGDYLDFGRSETWVRSDL